MRHVKKIDSLAVFGVGAWAGEAAMQRNPEIRHASGGSACAVRLALPATGESARARPAHSRPSGRWARRAAEAASFHAL